MVGKLDRIAVLFTDLLKMSVATVIVRCDLASV